MAMDSDKWFGVYTHNFIIHDNRIVSRQFIILKQQNGLFQFTDFHRYISSSRKVKNIADNANNRFYFVAQLLNYACFCRGVRKVDDLSIDIVKDFLNAYGTCTLPMDDEGTSRTKATVEKCVRTAIDFCKAYIADRGQACAMGEAELYKEVTKRNKQGRVIKVKEPVFEVRYIKKPHKAIYRDMPDAAFRLLLNHIVHNHPGVLGLVMGSAFGGLRPSEACNMRRPDSPLGPGIIFEAVDGIVYKVKIDIQEELNLRSDFIRVGGIKKERMQPIPDIFLDAFLDLYNIYIKYLAGRKYETDYGAFTVNKQGRAMTYNSYLNKFHDIIQNEMIPIYLADDEPQVVRFGRTLMDNKLSPHVFRHWFSVQLVLSGIDRDTLQYLRGDSNPDSAITYLQNKGELEKQYRKVSNDIFAYMSWAAEKKIHEKY